MANKETETEKEEIQEEKNHQNDILDDNHDKKNEDSTPEGKTSSGSLNGGAAEKLDASKEQDVTVASEDVRHGSLSTSSNSEVPEDRSTSCLRESNDTKSEAELQPSSGKESGDQTSAVEHSGSTEALKDVEISDAPPSEKKEAQQLPASNLVGEPSNSTEAPKDADIVSDSHNSEKNDPQHQATSNPVEEPHQPSEALKDVDMVSNTQHSEKEQPQPVKSNATVENGASTLSLSLSDYSRMMTMTVILLMPLTVDGFQSECCDKWRSYLIYPFCCREIRVFLFRGYLAAVGSFLYMEVTLKL